MADEIERQNGTAEHNEERFEDFGHDNGFRYWWEIDVRRLLGFQDSRGWDKASGRAIAACATLGIRIQENFRLVVRDVDGKPVSDCKLSRFACYLIAMNSDPRRPQVAKAQDYFATFAEAARQVALVLDGVERVVVHDQAFDAVHDYALFQNAGYRALYNMNLSQFETLKAASGDRPPRDLMAEEPQAANLFRISRTEGNLWKESLRGTHDPRRRFPRAADLRLAKSNLEQTPKTPETLGKKKVAPKPTTNR